MAVEVASVVCGGCGGRFELSTRRVFEHRRTGREPTCRICRRGPSLTMTRAERRRFVIWWIDESGLSLRALREIAG